MPSGIDLILADHQRVNAMFARHSGTGDGATVGQILDALTAHDDAEHSVLYPFAMSLLGDAALIERCELAHRQSRRSWTTSVARKELRWRQRSESCKPR